MTVVSGDCSAPGLGLKLSDRRMLEDEVNIVFHGAATVRFDETMKTAVDINVIGTQNILDLAREIVNLKVSLKCNILCHICRLFSSFLLNSNALHCDTVAE